MLDISNIIIGFEYNGFQMTAMDSYCLGYCITHSQCQWVLELYGMDEENMNMLVAGASLKPDSCHGRVVGL